MTADVVEALKRAVPASLRVTLHDGTVRTVAIAKAGNRWSKASKVLDALDWEQIECLDAKGHVTSVLESDLEDEDDNEPGDGGSGRDAAIARIMLNVMQTTMKEFRSTFDSQIRGLGELCGALTEGTRHLSDTYRQALSVQAAHLAAPPTEGGNEVMEMMKMAFMLRAGGPPPIKKEG
jgi:hypothetical protein